MFRFVRRCQEREKKGEDREERKERGLFAFR
jgi:hypothetical protein